MESGNDRFLCGPDHVREADAGRPEAGLAVDFRQTVLRDSQPCRGRDWPGAPDSSTSAEQTCAALGYNEDVVHYPLPFLVFP